MNRDVKTERLSQLVNDGEIIDIENLLLQAMKWLKGEINDPGCPRRHN